MRKLANAIGFTYLGFALYIITDPWHDEIQEVATDIKDNVYWNWSVGRFIIEAYTDLFLLTGKA